jgi:hypothetical protein
MEKFNKSKEAARAIGQNAAAFATNPKAQSVRAYTAAKDMAEGLIAPARARSPLKPENRPGVPVEALKNGGMVKMSKASTPHKVKC